MVPSGSCPADLVVVELGEPDVAVRARGDLKGTRRNRQGEFGDRAVHGHPSDLVAVVFDEPDVAVRARGDALGIGGGRRNRELREDARPW